MNIFTKKYQVDYSDNELIKSVLSGDTIALTTLVEKHQPFIYNLDAAFNRVNVIENNGYFLARFRDKDSRKIYPDF